VGVLTTARAGLNNLFDLLAASATGFAESIEQGATIMHMASITVIEVWTWKECFFVVIMEM
jgi:hypothetical protein